MDLTMRLKQLRHSLGMTQTEFARNVGLARNTIATYETGRRKPSSTVVELIRHKYRVNARWLETGEGPMQTISLDELAIRNHLTLADLKLVIAYMSAPELKRKRMREMVCEAVEARELLKNDACPGCKNRGGGG